MGVATVTLFLLACLAALYVPDGCAAIAFPGHVVHPDNQTGHPLDAHEKMVGPAEKVEYVRGLRVRIFNCMTTIVLVS